jgi:hypothetical protein
MLQPSLNRGFPKTSVFWKALLKFRSFARLKARKTARAKAQACPKTMRFSAWSISFGIGSI